MIPGPRRDSRLFEAVCLSAAMVLMAAMGAAGLAGVGRLACLVAFRPAFPDQRCLGPGA
jgi:hypothetical protein